MKMTKDDLPEKTQEFLDEFKRVVKSQDLSPEKELQVYIVILTKFVMNYSNNGSLEALGVIEALKVSLISSMFDVRPNKMDVFDFSFGDFEDKFPLPKDKLDIN